MRILAVDTSAVASSVAILDDQSIRSSFQINAKLTHSQTILPMVDAALQSSATPMGSIDAFAVTVGPGSFTGIRIGVSAVKGISMAQNKPCIAVSTLESLAYNLKGFQGIACAVMDARRNQVYNALFSLEENEIKRLTSDRAIAVEALCEEIKNLKKNVFLVGDGADLCYTVYKDKIKNVQLVPAHLKFQHAVSVGQIARIKANSNEFLAPEKIMPFYLRPSQAEREMQKKEGIQ